MRARWLSTLALVALVQACTSSTGPAPVDTSEHAVLAKPVDLTLSYGQDATVPGTDLQVAFDSVTSDFRCPTDVRCLTPGNAVVRLRLIFGSDQPFELNLNTNVDPTSQGVGNYQIGILDLSPLPTGHEPIRMVAYTVTVRVASIRP